MPVPAYSRLDVEERRSQLLELGAKLFTDHGYEVLSMAEIARQAGISKALLYHYFPSKSSFFQATLAQAAADLARRTAPDPGLGPAAQLKMSLAAFLAWVEERDASYRKLLESAGSVTEVRELVDDVRRTTAERILSGLAGASRSSSARARTAVNAWLWFIDGAVLDWLDHRDFDRGRLHEQLVATLAGALRAAGEPEMAAQIEG